MSHVRRRQVLVDKSFQFQYLKIWIVMGLVLATTLVVLIVVPRMLERRQVAPLIIQILVGACLFILLYSSLMGVITIILTHRVAGAAFATRRFLQKMLEGSHNDRLSLRKNDYLQDLAEEINSLNDEMKRRQTEMSTLSSDLDRLSQQLDGSSGITPDQKNAIKDAAVRLRSTLGRPAPSA